MFKIVSTIGPISANIGTLKKIINSSDLIRLNTIVYTTLEIVRKITFLLYPIIPETSLKALKIFNLSEADIKLKTISNNEFIIKGNMINKIDILIKKIEKNND